MNCLSKQRFIGEHSSALSQDYVCVIAGKCSGYIFFNRTIIIEIIIKGLILYSWLDIWVRNCACTTLKSVLKMHLITFILYCIPSGVWLCSQNDSVNFKMMLIKLAIFIKYFNLFVHCFYNWVLLKYITVKDQLYICNI